MKKLFYAILGALIISTFASCGSTTTTKTSSSVSASQTSASKSTSIVEVTDGDYDLSFSERDSDSSYDESSAVKITFSDSKAESSSDSVKVSGSEVTITEEGTYIISGTSSDGKITVKADENAKIQLVLRGVNLTSSGSAIVVESADKVFVTLADGSENVIKDASSYSEKIGDTTVDAAIFSKCDLSINGSGKLTVTGSFKHGIVSKDDLVIAGGDITVTAASTALEGKDSVKIKDATLTVKAGSDGIRATNTEKTGKGFVYIASGTVKIESEKDGVQAATLLRIDGGDIDITTADGAGEVKSGEEMGFGQGFQSSYDTEDSESAKALKSESELTVTGGKINISSSDDAIHANESVHITGGTITAATGDDGIHADSTLTIDGGDITITQSYEGIEAGEITVNDGNISVTASDDGFNAGGGDSGEGGQGMFDADASKTLTINGGYVYVNADGDGLDSNGYLTITGGTVLVSGPQNDGNGALDYGTEAKITGGTLVAIGSSGMAETITGDGQCTIMTDVTTQSGGTLCSLVDSDGNVIASFTASKQYSNVVFSSPEIKSGETYKIICGGTNSEADDNGYASSGTVSGGTEVAEITMDFDNYSNGGSRMGGGQGGPGGNGMPQMGGF